MQSILTVSVERNILETRLCCVCSCYSELRPDKTQYVHTFTTEEKTQIPYENGWWNCNRRLMRESWSLVDKKRRWIVRFHLGTMSQTIWNETSILNGYIYYNLNKILSNFWRCIYTIFLMHTPLKTRHFFFFFFFFVFAFIQFFSWFTTLPHANLLCFGKKINNMFDHTKDQQKKKNEYEMCCCNWSARRNSEK